MKGTLHSRRLVLPEVQKGIAYFEQAIEVDPRYTLAYVELSNAYRALVLTSEAPPTEMMPKAKAAAQKAVELDPNLGEAWSALAFVDFWYDFDPVSAERNQVKALELEPNNPQSHFAYAHLLSNLGRHDEALAEIKKARESDPLSLVTNALEGQILTFAGREDEALTVLQNTIDMDPNFWLGHLFISRAYIQRGRFNDAIAAAAKARELTGGNSEAAAIMAYAYARSGRPTEARKVLAELEDRAKARYVPAYSFAIVYMGMGDRSRALDLLEKAYEQRESLLVFLKVERRWDELRGEPRFAALIGRLNMET
jgi:serine/threonine-protein kinase